MASPFVAEVRIFPLSFAPKGWAFCDGQIMPISQNTALFSLLGTTYGGDGKSNFALPDMQGNAPMHPGQGPGLSQRFLGENGGASIVTLALSELPAHTHALQGNDFPADLPAPDPTETYARAKPGEAYAAPGAPAQFNANAIGFTGSTLPHNNMMPYLTLNFCIALQGVFPPRS